MGIPNHEAELDELLVDGQEDEVYTARVDEHFGIRDLGSAMWADSILRTKELELADIQRIKQERKAKLQIELDIIDNWDIRVSKKPLDDIEFFKAHLNVYHRNVIAAEEVINKELELAGKKTKPISKTIKLAHRNLTSSVQQPEILINGVEISKVKDDPTFVKFVKENNPEFISTTEEVKWGEYKKTLKSLEVDGKLVYTDDAGQVVDFITLIKREDKFEIKIPKAE